MKVLVTGVTGFLGGRLAARLAASGHQVRGLVRDEARWGSRPPGVEVVEGDVTDAPRVSRAGEGCDAIIHAAALVKMWVRDRSRFDRVNVDGLANVIEAGRSAGAKLVYVSSFIALGPTDGRVFDEETSRSPGPFHNDYERTKFLADRLARASGDGPRAPVRIYPGVVYGPGALTDGNHVVALLLKHARGQLPGLLGRGDLRQCFAFVDDVVNGIVAALERGTPGRGYILGGENRTALELFHAFHSASGVPPPRRRIPLRLARWIGRLQRWRGEWLNVEPELTDEVVGIYAHEWSYSSGRAERELGYRITPFEQGIERTVAWLRETGEL